MKIYNKAVLPLGFKAGAVSAGIKKSSALDLALFYSIFPAVAAGKFTTSSLAAAPVLFCKSSLKRGKPLRAIITNSGNANCFTGSQGMIDVCRTAQEVSRLMGVARDSVLVSSTGVIGKKLPFLKIKRSLPDLVKGLSVDGIDKAKKAILTTDTFVKEITVKVKLGGQAVTLCGIAKGAGMISPNMATLLAFVFTDADISRKALACALDAAVENSFNRITVDGCMSTNDTVIVMANAQAGNKQIQEKSSPEHFGEFSKALNLVCLHLAKMIVRDAEGCTKFIQITVAGAKDDSEAKKVGLAIANSNLFKCAVYGQNPNFGRIAASIGQTQVDLKEENVKIAVSTLKRRDIYVRVSLKRGSASATVYTSDLTPEYVRINAEYS